MPFVHFIYDNNVILSKPRVASELSQQHALYWGQRMKMISVLIQGTTSVRNNILVLDVFVPSKRTWYAISDPYMFRDS